MDVFTLFLWGIVALLGFVIVWLVAFSGYKPDLYWDPETHAESAHEVKYPKYNIPRKCLVTGGCGFLGRHIVSVLLDQGCEVTVFDIRGSIPDKRVRVIHGDLVDKAQVVAAFKGQELVFHCASPPPALNNAKLFHAVNVTGSQNVVDACIEVGVTRLVFTSSASVVYDGSNQVNVDEGIGYPTKYRDTYCETKALAEQLVLKHSKESGGALNAVAVRPHGLFGANDPQLVPTLVKTAKAGKMKFAIGTGFTLADFTYIGNVVHSHMLAAQACTPGNAAVGNVYFITNDQPVSFWGFMSSILVSLGYTPPSRHLPYGPILALSYVASSIAGLFGKTITFSPSRMQLAGTHHYYNCSKAKKDLGYRPLWSVEQGLVLNQEAFLKLANPDVPQIVSRTRPIKMSEVAEHNTADDVWVVMDGNVYDVSEYVAYHPGGDAILRHAGGDATEGFHGPQHPSSVFETVKKFQVGRAVQ